MVLVRFLRVFASTLDCFLSYHRNPRWHGYEAGEYALTDNQGHPSSRAIVAGAFAKATEKYRFELWDAVDEPIVGILISWESEATYAQLALRGVPNNASNRPFFERSISSCHTRWRFFDRR